MRSMVPLMLVHAHNQLGSRLELPRNLASTSPDLTTYSVFFRRRITRYAEWRRSFRRLILRFFEMFSVGIFLNKCNERVALGFFVRRSWELFGTGAV